MTGKMELILNAVGVALAAACLAFAANADLKDIDGNAVSNTTSFASVDGESGTVGDFLGVGGFATKDAVDDGMTALSNNLTRAIEEATPVDYAHVAQMASNAAPAAASVAKDATNYTDRVTSDLAASKRGLLDLVVYEQKIVTNSVTDAESTVVGVTTNTIPTTNSLATTGLVNALVEARVPRTRTVNMKPLSSDITLSAADVKVSLVPQTEIVETATTNDAGEVVTTVTTNATGKATVSVGDESATFYTADEADEKLEAISSSLKGHTDSKDNPHGVTAAQVGVSLADATSVTTNEAGEVVTNAVANVKRLTVDKANADLTTKKYVDAATSEAVKPILSNTNVTFRIDGKDLLIVGTNDTTLWNSYYAPRASDQTSPTSSVPAVAEKKYPLFIIRLNEDSSAPKFSDIELKATTNNFANESMVFYGGTSVNGNSARLLSGFVPDWFRLYVLSSEVGGDARKWTRIRNTLDLADGYKPRDVAIIVDPSMLRREQGGEWCSDQNDELVWSFVRMTDGVTDEGAETDADGKSSLWRPAMPVRWYSKLPAWAEQEVPTL